VPLKNIHLQKNTQKLHTFDRLLKQHEVCNGYAIFLPFCVTEITYLLLF
jgi:hypothetical protein